MNGEHWLGMLLTLLLAVGERGETSERDRTAQKRRE